MRTEEVDGAKLVKTVAENMEEIFRRKAEATRVSLINTNKTTTTKIATLAAFFIIYLWFHK